MKSIPNLDWKVLATHMEKQAKEYGWKAMLLRSKTARTMEVLSRMMKRPEIIQMQNEGRPIEEIHKRSHELWPEEERKLLDELREGIPLEKQLEQAIKEERYEDAQEIKQQLVQLEKATS